MIIIVHLLLEGDRAWSVGINSMQRTVHGTMLSLPHTVREKQGTVHGMHA
jgi:hypothetical protein